MARFVYLGPPGEQVERNFHQLTGEWVTGVPRDIDDAAAVAWLRRHPHWMALDAEDEPEPVRAPEPPRRGPGRPRRVTP